MRVLFVFCFLSVAYLFGGISEKEAEAIGIQIWKNEGGGKVDNLTAWNKGESFASLGIGHFIWYPSGQKGPFREMFPDFIKYLKKEKISLPEWLESGGGCPWRTREEFLREFESQKMVQLRRFLQESIAWQTQFMIKRMENALPEMVKDFTEARKKQITEQFNRLLSDPVGAYVLVDYVNFKGEGTSEQERYRGEGWGLRQVLELMKNADEKVVEEFVACAKKVLLRRVENAPPERGEKRWLKGWINRIDDYTTVGYQLGFGLRQSPGIQRS